MKTPYIVSMLVLLAVAIGGSVAGYRGAVHKVESHHAEAHEKKEHGGHAPAAHEAEHKEEAHAEAPKEGETAEAEHKEEAHAETAPTEAQEETPATEASTEAHTEAAPAETQEETPAAEAAPAGDIEAGKSAFGSCAGCHGADAKGGFAPSLIAVGAWPTADFAKVLREGVRPDGGKVAPTMPRFNESQISDQDLVNIQAWLKSL